MPKVRLTQETGKVKQPRIRKTISLPSEFWGHLEKMGADEIHRNKSFIIQKLIKQDMDKLAHR